MKKLNIIYEDKEILVINKESGELTISSEKEKIRTLYHEASLYVKKQYPKNKIFIVNRLDKDTSGLVMFAKTQEKKLQLQNMWDKVNREYIAVVEGKLPKQKDTLKSYLVEDKTYNVYSTNNPKKGKLAITEYEVLATSKSYSLIKINIKTGRKNQIRVQLSDIGNPIIGDKKYNSKTNPLKRLALHAYLISYENKGKQYKFETKYPENFISMFNLK